MKALARAMADELSDQDLDELGELVWEHWQHQRSLHPSIPTPLIDSILERARAAGARGGKALGASGGGCVLVIAGDDNVDAGDGGGHRARTTPGADSDRRDRPHLQPTQRRRSAIRWRS